MVAAWRRIPWWGHALAIWAASRVVSTALLVAVASMQGASPYTGARPDLLAFSTMWDARWYFRIVDHGYPDALPLEPDGSVGESAWAFMPAYPMLVRALARLGVDGQLAAVGLAWAASAIFAVLAFALLRDVVPRHAPFALALMLAGPASPVLQVAYAESLHLALLAGALLALRRRRWWMLAAVVPLMALTRPSGLAFALALGIVWLWRLRHDRHDDRWRTDRWLLPGLAAWALAWGLAWPAIAAIQTGRLDAYVATELGWRRRYVGAVDLVPGGGWVGGMEWWFGGAGLTLLAVLVGAAVWLLPRRGVQRDLGVEAWAWVVAYALYLLAVWLPQTSTWRLLLPLLPLAAAIATLPGRWWRAPLIAAAVASQALWLHACWLVVAVDWTIP